MVFNCVARLIGGIILDHVKFKTYFAEILSLSMILALTFPMVASNDFIFGVYLSLSYFISGSIFVSMPIYYAKVFGPEIGSQAYAYFFTSNAVSTLMFSFVVKWMSGYFGYSGMLYLTGAASAAALGILMLLPQG